MGTILLILIVLLLLAAVAGGSRHAYRTYRGPEPSSGGHGLTILFALIIIFLLLALYGGFNVFNWFGDHVNVH